ncbi:protein ImuA [Breoghania corrubedonensis]|uniref:Protein ImuA n=1 Tax=Breoghania corrubedonensis TaxID=665038 RepID=A0A2T5V9I2_9HYPH|nr:DNA repair protein [Breoghania corrubedonensis]PTW60394.1 protein ImuA [Breoghania corrubedonensis]
MSSQRRIADLSGIVRAHAPVSDRAPLGAEVVDRLLGGGLVRGALHEVRCEHVREIAAASGFLIGLIERLHASSGRVVWVADPATSLDAGTLFPQGLAQIGFDPARLVHVLPHDLATALWAADEAVKCRGLAAVVLQIRGNPARLDLTATRRLMLRAQENGGFACMLRQSAEAQASAAATRWHVRAESSAPPGTLSTPSAPRWRVTLEKNREGRTGEWSLAWNSECKVFEHAPETRSETCSAENSGPRLHAPAERPGGAAQMGQVVAFEAAS